MTDIFPAPDGRGSIPHGVRSLIVALFFTSFATVGQITILGKQVFDMTGRELDLGLLGLFEFLPILLLAPVAGRVADRYDRRWVFRVGLVAEMGVSLSLFAYVAGDPTSVWPIFALMAAMGTARAFVAPASRSLPIDLAPLDVVERVVAVRSVAFQLGTIAGPVVAGFVFVAGPSYPYLVAMAAYLTAGAILVTVPPSGVARLGRTTRGGAWPEAFEGLRFMRRNPVVLGAISLDLFAVLLGGAVALLPAIAEERLGVGAVGLGGLRAAVGIGAFVSAVIFSIRPVRRRVGRVLLVGVAVFGVATIVLGLTRSYVVAFVALFVLAAADAISVFCRATIVPLATPESMRGRVLAVENMFIGASNELGAVESGVAGHFLGVVGAVVTGGIGTLVIVVLWWTRFPALRDIDRFADVRPSEPVPP